MARGRGLAAVLATALLGAAGAGAAPPQPGLFVPGQSLGGLRLGMTPAQVKGAWGTGFGRCRGCRNETWYFNYAPFSPEGAGVQFRRGRVEAIFTLWSPGGWRTPRGLRIGDVEARVTALHSPLKPGDCGSYRALLGRKGRTVSAFYLVGGRVWGFALLRFPASPCL